MLDKTIADSFPASDPPSTDPAPSADSLCFECGGSYLVPLRDILLSHKILHDGCPVAAETGCPPVFQSQLASHWAINALDEARRQLERRANADGGELVLTSTSEPLGERGKCGSSRSQDTSAAAQTLWSSGMD
jgi:hypothetical protein